MNINALLKDLISKYGLPAAIAIAVALVILAYVYGVDVSKIITDLLPTVTPSS